MSVLNAALQMWQPRHSICRSLPPRAFGGTGVRELPVERYTTSVVRNSLS